MIQAEKPEQVLPTAVASLGKPKQKEQPTQATPTNNWLIYTLLTLGLIIMIVPFVWMILSSLKGPAELAHLPPTWLPTAPTLINYNNLFTQLNFPVYFLNSLILAVSVTVLNLLFCSMLGYALAKLKFRGRNTLFLLVLATFMIPSAVTLVPLFVLMSNLGLVNNLLAVILPEAAAGIGGTGGCYRRCTATDELLDAGRVDGAGEFYLFWRVVLPLCGPALGTLTILTFLASWNDFTWPLIVLTSD